MTKHTPGPWMFCGRDIISLHAMPKASGPLVAIVDDNDDRFTEADANLIAAAPDLLAACEAAVEYMQRPLDIDEVIRVGSLLRAAIAKARGQG